MNNTVIRVENVSKQYRLGKVGTGTLSHDLNRWWHLVRGREDPYLKIGEVNDRAIKGTSEYVWALKAINFEVKQGEVLGIIGKNGAGKSTLLKILSRTTSPTTGTVKAKGRVASLLEVGTGFHPELTGRENIFMNGAILGMSKQDIKTKFDEIVDFSGVEKYIDTPVKRYSSGMYVRLAFAVAAHLEPEILIIDEVLAVGDQEFQKKCLSKINAVAGEGRTVLFVSHNMAAIQNLCTHGLLLEHGQIVFSGSVDSTIETYLAVKNNSLNEIENYEGPRLGSGPVRITRIEFRDSRNKKVEQVFSGQDFKIVLHYKSEAPLTKLALIPGIQLTDRMETPVTLHHSRLNGKTFLSVNTSGAFIFDIKKLPLVSGIYNLTFSLINLGIHMDGISNITKLGVIDGDYYGSGEIPPPSRAICLLDGNWTQE